MAGKSPEPLYLAGEMGLVYHSIDAGEHFSVLDTPVNASLFAVKATDDNLVLLGLRGSLWTTRFSSDDWREIPIPTEYSLVTATKNASEHLVLGDVGGGLWSLQLEGEPHVSPIHQNVGFPLSALLQQDAQSELLAVGAAGVRVVDGGDYEH